MKIKITREIEVQDQLICYTGDAKCKELCDSGDMWLCANYNSHVHWSDRAGGFIRCRECIEAQRQYLEERD